MAVILHDVFLKHGLLQTEVRYMYRNFRKFKIFMCEYFFEYIYLLI